MRTHFSLIFFRLHSSFNYFQVFRQQWLDLIEMLSVCPRDVDKLAVSAIPVVGEAIQFARIVVVRNATAFSNALTFLLMSVAHTHTIKRKNHRRTSQSAGYDLHKQYFKGAFLFFLVVQIMLSD